MSKQTRERNLPKPYVITTKNPDHAQWLADKTGCKPFEGEYIGLERDGEILAVCGYDDYTGSSIRSHIAVERVNREFLRFIFAYPFEQLGVKKMIAPVHSQNDKCIVFCRKLGFVTEAVIKDLFPDGDVLFLTLTKDRCRMLSIGRP